MQNITDLSRKLISGSLTARGLVEQSLARIGAAEDPQARIFLSLYRETALAEADLVDRGRAAGLSLPAHAGIPIATKDLFDIAGEVTRAGSHVLDDQPPAKVDAPSMTRLRRAGFIIIGKAAMTEFAYSGLGVNVHFGTPRNPHDSAAARIPGGSSSGAGVAISTALVPAAIGTDTGGSCRIPAAFCGIVGFKPTSTRVPRAGVVPLSTSLDCVGPLATSVSCCAVLDAILSTGEAADVESMPEGGLRIAVLEGYPTERMDDAVGAARDAALTRLSGRGVRLSRLEIPELAELPTVNAKGGLVGAEAYAWHRPHLERVPDRYDPWVRARFSAGKSQSAADYIDVLNHRARIRVVFAARTDAFDAVLLPTVQILPPTMAELADSDHSNATNLLCLRNTAIGNFLDLPAISIPCQSKGNLPVGLMLMGRSGQDRRLLSIARGLEHLIRGH